MPADPRFLEVKDNPLQQGGLAPTLIREVFAPPRGHNLDIRWVLDRPTLEKLLDVAKASNTGRVVVHNVSLRVRRWHDPSGHVFETYTLVGSDAQAESVGTGGLARGQAPGAGSIFGGG